MSIKVLIVEDEYMIAAQIRNILSMFGHKVCGIASTGMKAVEIAKSEKPDIALIDVRLIGKMNGIETARSIMSVKKIPIIFMTGYMDTDLMDQIMELNPAACFNKPLAASDISETINSLFPDGGTENSETADSMP